MAKSESRIMFKQLNPHFCKTYLIGEEGKAEVVLVDPVLEHVQDYSKFLTQNHYKLTHVIDTHTHADHISGAAALRDLTNCEYVMYQTAPADCVSIRVTDGFECHLGSIPVKVMHTPGHTQDSITLIFPDRILTGDALFLDDGGAGRDDLPGGDPGQHWETLQKIMALPDHLIVCPAHDYRHREPSSLKQQKISNPFLKARSKQEFIKYLEDLKLGPADWMKDVLKANYACARDPKAAWIPVDAPACEVKGTMAQGANDLKATQIKALDLKQSLKSKQPPLLVDVREPAELKSDLGHLSNVKNIPIGSFSSRLRELESFKDKKIVTVCRSGGRATTAAQILMQAGFPQVQVLEGGMTAWRSAGFPVLKN